MSRPLPISAKRFAQFGSDMANSSPCLSTLSECKRFRALFGVAPNICALLWDLLSHRRPISSRPVHLLWPLLFIKVYGSENTHRAIAGVDAKTFRKWSWCFVHLLADLQIVRIKYFCQEHSKLLYFQYANLFRTGKYIHSLI